METESERLAGPFPSANLLLVLRPQVGVASVLAETARASKLPETDLKALSALPQLALAVIFASTQLTPTGPTIGLATKIKRGMPLRALLLKTADALVESALLAKADVDRIRAGHGKLHAARDLVALVALYARHAAKVRGKHAITAAPPAPTSVIACGRCSSPVTMACGARARTSSAGARRTRRSRRSRRAAGGDRRRRARPQRRPS